jgi:hypothetical protein
VDSRHDCVGQRSNIAFGVLEVKGYTTSLRTCVTYYCDGNFKFLL